ncbi:MAG: SdrD B-like domain-containing protein [Blastocatellia bacterium]
MLSTQPHILLIGTLLISLAGSVVAQCTNKPFAPCKLYETADVAFIGTVKAINYSAPMAEGSGISKKILRNKEILLTVKEAFKGNAEKQTEITLTTTQIQRRASSGELVFLKYVDADCPFDEFVQDETYLVYAKHNSSTPGLALFADHAVIVSEADSAITYLHNRKTGNLNAMLYGRVVRKIRPLDYDLGNMPKRPIRNVKVEIQSDTQRFTTTTDETGNYLFSDIPPGEYVIRYDVPEGLEAEGNSKKLNLSAQPCRQYDMEALTTGQISGTVFSHEGRPKAVEVELIVATEINTPNPRKFIVSADWQSGKFEFKNIPPAQYLLGVNLSKLCHQQAQHGRISSWEVTCRPRLYYPNVSEISQATLIDLTEGEQRKDFDLRLPSPFSKRTISGVAVFPDGKPVVNAEISLMVVDGDSVTFGELAKTDEYGRFSISAYNDLKSWVSAVVNIKGKYLHSEPLEFSMNGDINGIKLMLSSPGKFCALCYNKYRKRKGSPPQ